MNKHARIVRELVTDLAKKAGATVRFENGRKHDKYFVTFNGKTRVRAYSHNTGGHTAGQLGCIRREFAALIKELST